MRFPRRLTGIVLAAVSLSVTIGTDARAGVNMGLCHPYSSRLSVPSDYAIDACFDGSSLVLRDSIQMVFTVSRSGAVGTPSRSESDYGFAAGVERALSRDPNIFLPGDQLTFPVGAGGGKVTITPSRDTGRYTIAGQVATFLPGKSAAVGNAAVGLVTDIDNAYTTNQQCLVGKNWFEQLGCLAVLALNAKNAVKKAVETGGASFIESIPGAIINGILTGAAFSQWTEASVTAIQKVEHTHTTVTVAAEGAGGGGGGSPSGPQSSGPSAPSGGGSGGSAALPAGEFSVQNAASGIFWRSGPDWNTAEASSGNGFYPGTVIAVSCYQAGAGNVPGSSDTMWEQSSWVSGPGHGSGWINEHFINDGSPINQPSPGVPACQQSVPAPGQTPTPPAQTPTPTPPAPTPTPSSPVPAAQTWSETVGGNANTWTDYTNAGGTQGPTIPGGQTVQIACKISGFRVADGNTWWYRIASGPWNGAFYVSADAFYNNGATSGTLHGTPYLDPSVADC